MSVAFEIPRQEVESVSVQDEHMAGEVLGSLMGQTDRSIASIVEKSTGIPTNEEVVPPGHDCTKCIIDAASCTLIQIAQDNGGDNPIMKRMQAVQLLTQENPDFLKQDNAQQLIKEKMISLGYQPPKKSPPLHEGIYKSKKSNNAVEATNTESNIFKDGSSLIQEEVVTELPTSHQEIVQKVPVPEPSPALATPDAQRKVTQPAAETPTELPSPPKPIVERAPDPSPPVKVRIEPTTVREKPQAEVETNPVGQDPSTDSGLEDTATSYTTDIPDHPSTSDIPTIPTEHRTHKQSPTPEKIEEPQDAPGLENAQHLEIHPLQPKQERRPPPIEIPTVIDTTVQKETTNDEASTEVQPSKSATPIIPHVSPHEQVNSRGHVQFSSTSSESSDVSTSKKHHEITKKVKKEAVSKKKKPTSAEVQEKIKLSNEHTPSSKKPSQKNTESGIYTPPIETPDQPEETDIISFDIQEPVQDEHSEDVLFDTDNDAITDPQEDIHDIHIDGFQIDELPDETIEEEARKITDSSLTEVEEVSSAAESFIVHTHHELENTLHIPEVETGPKDILETFEMTETTDSERDIPSQIPTEKDSQLFDTEVITVFSYSEQETVTLEENEQTLNTYQKSESNDFNNSEPDIFLSEISIPIEETPLDTGTISIIHIDIVSSPQEVDEVEHDQVTTEIEALDTVVLQVPKEELLPRIEEELSQEQSLPAAVLVIEKNIVEDDSSSQEETAKKVRKYEIIHISPEQLAFLLQFKSDLISLLALLQSFELETSSSMEIREKLLEVAPEELKNDTFGKHDDFLLIIRYLSTIFHIVTSYSILLISQNKQPTESPNIK